MAKYTTIRYGSSGDEVKKLQESLNSQGYKLDVDGQFGSATQSAVRYYQSKNGMTVDGIVGDNTWGKLTGGASTQASTNSTSGSTGSTGTAVITPGDNPGAYQNPYAGQDPGEYKSPYDQQIRDLYEQITSRPKFQFDIDGSSLYQQYRDQYTRLGKDAMENTQAAAAGLTGGYGSSYAQSAGQQAYNRYLQELTDKLPDIYAAERSAYDAEGDDLTAKYGMLLDKEQQAYSRWQDAYNRYQTQEQQAYSRWQDAYNLYLASQAAFYGGHSSGGSGSGDVTDAGSAYTDGIPYALVQQLRNQYPQGTISDLDSWNALATQYGTQALKDAGFRYGRLTTGTSAAAVDSYSSLRKTLQDYKAKGMTSQEVSRLVNSAVAEGILNGNQAQMLLKQFAGK